MASELITNTVVTVVGAMATALGGVAAAYLKKKLGVVEAQKVTELAKAAEQELQSKQSVVSQIVKAVQERAAASPGVDRLKAALPDIVAAFNKYGWEVDQTEIQNLIDAACKDFKLAFGDKWSATAQPAEPAAK